MYDVYRTYVRIWLNVIMFNCFFLLANILNKNIKTRGRPDTTYTFNGLSSDLAITRYKRFQFVQYILNACSRKTSGAVKRGVCVLIRTVLLFVSSNFTNESEFIINVLGHS